MFYVRTIEILDYKFEWFISFFIEKVQNWDGPKNIFRIGNITHRVVVLCGLGLCEIYIFFRLSLFDCLSYVTFSLACVVISILVYAPPPGSIYSDPMSGAPDNMSTPVSQGPVQSEKMSLFTHVTMLMVGALFL